MRSVEGPFAAVEGPFAAVEGPFAAVKGPFAARFPKLDRLFEAQSLEIPFPTLKTINLM